MPLSLLSIFIGFVVGVVATAIAWNLSVRNVRNPESSRLTAVWSLDDLVEPGRRPAIVAQRIAGVTPPPGSKVIVPEGAIGEVAPGVLATCDVRMHKDVRINAAIGRERALVLSGHLTPRAYGVLTQEATTVKALQADFSRMWEASTPYVERVEHVAQLGTMAGRYVQVQGTALELVEFRGKPMMRLTDGQTNVGVVAADGTGLAALQGRQVQVQGRMMREHGYAFVAADKVAALTPV